MCNYSSINYWVDCCSGGFQVVGIPPLVSSVLFSQSEQRLTAGLPSSQQADRCKTYHAFVPESQPFLSGCSFLQGGCFSPPLKCIYCQWRDPLRWDWAKQSITLKNDRWLALGQEASWRRNCRSFWSTASFWTAAITLEDENVTSCQGCMKTVRTRLCYLRCFFAEVPQSAWLTSPALFTSSH